MKVSIVIVNFRGWKRLRLCLESLHCLKQATFTWEVVIVDNQSNDGQLTSFINDFPEYSFIENTGNHGFANGCNVGAAHATGEFIFFLNPDTLANLDAFEQLLDGAVKNPEITILTCRQLNDKGKDTKPYGLFLRPATVTSLFRSIYRLTQHHLPKFQLKSGEWALSPEWVSGSAIFIKRTDFIKLGGWSEDYWMYFEDADLCKRVRGMGGNVALITNVQIIHNHGGSSRINTKVKALTKSEVLISKHVYISKHFSGMKQFLLQLYLVFNNLLVGHLIFAIIGLLFFFNRSLHVYTKVYRNIIRYYAGVVMHKTWISPRSVNIKT